jgi:hypothetical protein
VWSTLVTMLFVYVCEVTLWSGGDSEGNSDAMVSCVNVQVKVPVPQSRHFHSATSFSISQGMTEVILFGGRSKFLGPPMANTTMLRFGKLCVWVCTL